MDDLKEILRSVLQEELQPINQRLNNLENELQPISQRLNNLENELQSVKSQMNNRFDTMEAKMTLLEKNMATKEDVADIQAIKQATLEVSEKVNDLVEERDSKIHVLNKRLFKVESFIERLSSQ